MGTRVVVIKREIKLSQIGRKWESVTGKTGKGKTETEKLSTAE